MSAGDFTLPTSPPYLDGIFMLLVSAPDVWAVFDAPPCVPEIADRGMMGHAWRQRLLRRDGQDRLFTTSIEMDHMGALHDERLLRRLRRLIADGQRPTAVMISEMAVSRVVGNDLDLLTERVENAVGAPARLVKFVSLNRDFLDSYDSGMVAMAEALPDEAFTGESDSVGLVGYLMDRPEADHLANVRELEALVGALGLPVSATWMSGRPLADLARVGESKWIVALPSGRRAAAKIASRSGATVIELPLPVGLDGTSRWLRTLGAALGRDAQAEDFIKQRLSQVVPLLTPFVTRLFAGKRVAVIAEPGLAVGVDGYLRELGVDVIGPLYRCRRPPRAIAGTAPIPANRCDPTVGSVQRLVKGALDDKARGGLDLIICSSWEREVLAPWGVAFLELGFPSFFHRPLVDDPFVGFTGALHFANRLADKLADLQHQRDLAPLAREVESERAAAHATPAQPAVTTPSA